MERSTFSITLIALGALCVSLGVVMLLIIGYTQLTRDTLRRLSVHFIADVDFDSDVTFIIYTTFEMLDPDSHNKVSLEPKNTHYHILAKQLESLSNYDNAYNERYNDILDIINDKLDEAKLDGFKRYPSHTDRPKTVHDCNNELTALHSFVVTKLTTGNKQTHYIAGKAVNQIVKQLQIKYPNDVRTQFDAVFEEIAEDA